jgi:flagellar motor switch protein FliN/FliY
MEDESRPGSGRASVRPVQLEELKPGPEAARALVDGSLELVQDVKVRLTMSVGGAQLSIGELYALKEGAVLKLDKATSDPIDIYLDARLVARGELMVAGDHFAIRITEIGGKA